MMGGEDGNAPSSSVLISGSVCTFHIVCNRWGSSGMQVIVSMLHWRNDIEFPSSSIFLPGSSPLGLPCLAWDQPGYVRWCVDGDGDVMNVDPLIMTFGVAHGETVFPICSHQISKEWDGKAVHFLFFTKSNMLSSTGDPWSSASELVPPLPPTRWWWSWWWWMWCWVCWSRRL